MKNLGELTSAIAKQIAIAKRCRAEGDYRICEGRGCGWARMCNMSTTLNDENAARRVVDMLIRLAEKTPPAAARTTRSITDA